MTTDQLAEAIERLRAWAEYRAGAQRPGDSDLLAVCTAAARCAEADARADHHAKQLMGYEQRCAEAERERDEARAERRYEYGWESRAIEAMQTLDGIERLLRAGRKLDMDGPAFCVTERRNSHCTVAMSRPTLPAAVAAAVAELDRSKEKP